MKKRFVTLMLCAVAAFGMFALAGCGSNNSGSSSASGSSSDGTPVSVYSREDGSGTRGAFIELTGVEAKDSSGNKVDNTITSAIITNSTSVMMSSVAGDPAGIGYISLGSMSDTVKAVAIDGVDATAENVSNGTYTVSRPFNIATKADLSPVATDFVAFIMSTEGQKIVTDNGYVAVSDAASAYAPTAVSGKIVVAGSSSVSPVMEKLIEAYKAVNSGAEIELQTSDSTTGMNLAKEGTCDIGMASRELKDSETSAGLTPTVIAKDGIAIIVNKDSKVSGLTTDQVKGIYTGEITNWGEVSA